jgi:hypothetical protein
MVVNQDCIVGQALDKALAESCRNADVSENDREWFGME